MSIYITGYEADPALMSGDDIIPFVEQAGQRDAWTTVTKFSALLDTLPVTTGTANGVLFLNGSKVVTSGSGLTFDGALLTNTVSDAATALKLAGATGKFRFRPYVDATYGAVIDSTNAAEGAYLPMSFYGTNIYTNPDTAAIWRIGGSEQMRLTSTGLGIGTSSPTVKFSVGGNANDPTLNAASGIAEFRLATTQMLAIGGYSSGQYGVWLQGKQDNGGYTTAVFPLILNPSGGDVGIGTSSPAAKLDVADSSFFPSIALKRVGTGIWYVGGDNAGSTSNFRIALNTSQFVTIDTSGNLGLGVTPSAWGSGKAIEVGATGNGIWADSSYTDLMQNVLYSAGAYRYVRTASAARLDIENNTFRFLIAPSGTAGDAISFTQAMTLDASGNLLVGKTSINYGERIGILGAGASSSPTNINDLSGALFLISTNRGTTGFGGVGYNDGGGGGAAVVFGRGSSYNTQILFYTNPPSNMVSGGMTERLRVKENGQLRFVPLSSDPAGAEAGDVYYNSGTNKLRLYDGSTWVDLN